MENAVAWGLAKFVLVILLLIAAFWVVFQYCMAYGIGA